MIAIQQSQQNRESYERYAVEIGRIYHKVTQAYRRRIEHLERERSVSSSNAFTNASMRAYATTQAGAVAGQAVLAGPLQ